MLFDVSCQIPSNASLEMVVWCPLTSIFSLPYLYAFYKHVKIQSEKDYDNNIIFKEHQNLTKPLPNIATLVDFAFKNVHFAVFGKALNLTNFEIPFLIELIQIWTTQILCDQHDISSFMTQKDTFKDMGVSDQFLKCLITS